MKRIFLIIACILVFSFTYSQSGIVTGVLTDSENIPLPGVNVIVKGTSEGTQTDFDGNYSIQCNVGDILVFAYIGMETREVRVTPEMFGQASGEKLEYISVAAIQSNAYSKAIKKLKKKSDSVESVESSNKTYNKNNNAYFQFTRIKDIKVQDDKVQLTYFSPNIYFEVGYNSSFGVQFVRDKNLPQLQHTLSQGIPVSGELAFQGAETGNIFSYGPALNSLEFDGSNYIYDNNGMLTTLGNGNGNPAISYDNGLFENVVVNSNHLFFNISTDSELYGINLLNENYKDIFNKERSFKNKVAFNYNKNKEANKFGWKVLLTYQLEKDNQPNINGFQNNLLLNSWVTPPSFSNQQGTILPNNLQRRFSLQFNNPAWLLSNNRNSISDDYFVASVQNEIDISEDITLEGKLNYNYHNQEQKFGLFAGTAGFEDGFASNKTIKENTINMVGDFEYSKYKDGCKIEIKSIFNNTYSDLGFSFQESSGFAPFSFANSQNNIQTNQSKSRNILRVLNQFKYELDNKFELKFTNNSYYSSVQNNKWFLPSFYGKIDLKNLFEIYGGIYKFSISSNLSFDVNDTPLYYNNLSHNSLLILPQESLGYVSNNDLFINPSVDLEQIKNYETNLSFGLQWLGGNTEFNATYYNSITKGVVFPINRNNAFTLDNVANIRNSGFEFSIDSRIRIAGEFYYKTNISFSTYYTEVLKILSEEDRIAIAGFSTTSKNLIVDQPAGAIVGSAYLRYQQNNVVIGEDGFPLVSPNPQIIGNPIPDYNIGFSNSFEWKNLKLNVVIDIQKGGDIWNGTQNILDYIGTSQQSAIGRNVTNFIFNGVNQQGNINTIPVDFYNPNNPISENRFVRYGFEGVADDAIVDASYVNIKSLDISYAFKKRDNDLSFLRECKLGLYAKNLFTWSKFRGNSPYNTLYGNITGQNLNFFNMPLLTEIGLTLNIKI